MKGFGFLISGGIELLPAMEHLRKFEDILSKFIKIVKDHVIDALDLELAEILVQTLNEIIDALLKKEEQGVESAWLIRPYLVDVMMMALKSLAVF